MRNPTKTRLLRLAATVLLAVMLFTACASKAARAQERLELGQKYLTELNYTEAVASFTEAIELDPENIPAYMNRAEAYIALGEYEEAKADYGTVIEKTADQPYVQAEAYVGRAEVNEQITANADALNDYEAASGVLDKVDVEKTENVTEQMLEALKAKVYMACARLSALLGRDQAAAAGYTKALNSLAKLPDNTDVLDVKAAKVTSYMGRAAANEKLNNYSDVLPDYDALIDLGKDKTEERDILLAAMSLAKSKAGDLASADGWLDEVNHAEYADSIQLSDAEAVLKNAAELANAEGTKAYDKIKAALSTDAAKTAMQNVLARGYQLRCYDASGKMLAVYANAAAWDDVNKTENGTVTAAALAETAAPTEEEIGKVSLAKLYVYYGGARGRSREGEGVWYILNPEKNDITAQSYIWKNDAPDGGFQQKEETKPEPAAPAPVAAKPAAVQPAAPAAANNSVSFTQKDMYGSYEMTVVYFVNGQAVEYSMDIHAPADAGIDVQGEAEAAMAVLGIYGIRGTYHFSQPVQGVVRENNRTVILVPAETTMTMEMHMVGRDGTVGSKTFNPFYILNGTRKTGAAVSQVTVHAGESVGPCTPKLYDIGITQSYGEDIVSVESVILRAVS